MKKVINATARSITFKFDEGLADVVFEPQCASSENQDYAILHGFAARIGDNAAITRNAENGFKVTEGMRREAVLELVNHYASGTTAWELKARARVVAQNPAILALATALGLTYEATQAKLVEDAMEALKA